MLMCVLILVIQTASRDSVYYTKMGVGTGGVVDMCTGEVVRGQLSTLRGRATEKVWYARSSGAGVNARGGGSSHFSQLCSFPDPSSSHRGGEGRAPRDNLNEVLEIS